MLTIECHLIFTIIKNRVNTLKVHIYRHPIENISCHIKHTYLKYIWLNELNLQSKLKTYVRRVVIGRKTK